jgi:hypothetical protein
MREAISPLPQYAIMAWCLVKHRDNFTLPYIHEAKRPETANPLLVSLTLSKEHVKMQKA